MAERYQALRNEVRSLGGFVTSDGGLRPLTADVNKNRSPSSMHYTGLAFDLFTNSGFFKPNVDPFVVSRGSDTYWTVWCRATGGEEKQVKAVYWESESSGVDLMKTVSGKFINFTELCRKHGFHSIGPRPAFTQSHNRSYLSAEWWHFQCNDLLIPSLSQFGIELLKLKGYSPDFIRGKSEAVWERRKLIYGKNWR